MPVKRRKWTPARIKEMRSWMLRGKTAVQYATYLAATPNAVYKTAEIYFGGWNTECALKDPLKPVGGYIVMVGQRMYLSEGGEKYLRRAWADTKVSADDICQELGVSAKPVRAWAKELGLGRKVFIPDPDDACREKKVKHVLEDWPKDMPRFGDDPRPVRNRRL